MVVILLRGRVAEPETTYGRQPVSFDNRRLRAEPAAYGLHRHIPHTQRSAERLLLCLSLSFFEIASPSLSRIRVS